MNRSIIRAAWLTAFVVGPATLYSAEFLGLGDLPGGRINSAAWGISGDGQVVVGKSESRTGQQAFRWTPETGMVGLGIPSGSNASDAFSASFDGSVIVGKGHGRQKAVRWTVDGMEVIPNMNTANSASADGSVIVGNFCCPTSIIWNEQDGTSGIGSLPSYSGNGIARGISGDGTTVVGIAGKLSGRGQAFLWTESSGMEGLGFLSGNEYSIAERISADGSTIVGTSDSSAGLQAFRWTREQGMVALGDLPGGRFRSDAVDVSGDGSVVVGTADCSTDCAFIWDEENQMRSLKDVLIDDYQLGKTVADWQLTQAWAVSDDGQVIVGGGTNPDGNREGWIAILKPPLQAGDADMDLDFDQRDLVKVQIAAKYLTGQEATWGEGDWNGAPGGVPGIPPQGDNMFDQVDIISALSGGMYLNGPYAALSLNGAEGDEQTSLVYDPATGELRVDAPASTQLTSIFVTSSTSAFVDTRPPVLDGPFDSFAADNIFKSTIGGSFGDISFGNVLPQALTEAEIAADLSVSGSLAGGGGLGEVDLVFVPEPAAVVLVIGGLLSLGLMRRRSQ